MKALMSLIMLLFFNFQPMFGQDSLVDKHRWEIGGGCNYFPLTYLDIWPVRFNSKSFGTNFLIKFRRNKQLIRLGFNSSLFPLIKYGSFSLNPNIGIEHILKKYKKFEIRAGGDVFLIGLYRKQNNSFPEYPDWGLSSVGDAGYFGPVISLGYHPNSFICISSELSGLLGYSIVPFQVKKISFFSHRFFGLNFFIKL